MRSKSAWTTAAFALIGASSLAAPLWAQGAGGAAPPWRGAGAPPCYGTDGGALKCAQSASSIAIRAGRLFDSKTGQMLTNQVVLMMGDRITEVGPAAQVRIPQGAQVIDLSQATVLPGLIDAHTHMFNTPKPGMSREASTLVAIQHLQDDLRAGFTAIRDMSTHGNGYADVDMKKAVEAGMFDGPRMRVSTRGIVWAGAGNAAPNNPLASAVVRTPDEARAAVRDQVEHGADWIKLFPAGAYSFSPTGEAKYLSTAPCKRPCLMTLPVAGSNEISTPPSFTMYSTPL